TASGDAVCQLRIAVNARARDENGQWGDKPNFFDVVVFGRQAETAGNFLSKGRRVGIDGRLSWREWQTQDGQRRQTVEVIANDLMFLDGRNDGERGGDASGDPWGDAGVRRGGGGGGGDLPIDRSDMQGSGPAQGTDDDIPF
ncbi:MAG: single-stranded DNA-binding protein, partial [Actinomycetota bacterium]